MKLVANAIYRLASAPPAGRSAADALRAIGCERPFSWLATLPAELLEPPGVDAAAALQGGFRDDADEGDLVAAGGRA